MSFKATIATVFVAACLLHIIRLFLFITGFWYLLGYSVFLEILIRCIRTRQGVRAMKAIATIIVEMGSFAFCSIGVVVILVTHSILSLFVHPFMFIAAAIVLVIPRIASFLRFQSIHQLYHPSLVSKRDLERLKRSGLRNWKLIKFGKDKHLSGLYIHGKNYESTQPMLFCHGNAGTIYDRIDNLTDISKHVGCDILIFDYGGMGDSVCIQDRMCQRGIIADTMDALCELVRRTRLRMTSTSTSKKKKENVDLNQVKPIIYGRSLGGAVAIHTVFNSLRKGIEIGGLIVENTFTSVAELVSYLVTNSDIMKWILYPFVVDKWQSIKKVKAMKGKRGWDTIPKLFISGESDELLHPEMMQKLYDASKSDGQRTYLKLYPHGEHNDTWQEPGYFQALQQFVFKC